MNDRSRLRLVRFDDPRAVERASDAPPLIALTLVWIAISVAVDPRGGFPLGDDWAYGRVALTLAEHGRFVPSFWQSMPLVTNALWGVPFVRIFGASWFSLRLSSLMAGWLAVIGAYYLLREVGARRARATAGAATLLANPWLVALSCTFMTDVPFLALVTWAAWAWLRAIGRCDGRWLALAATLGIAATLSRQVGLALPIAFAIPLLRRRAFGSRSWFAALAPIAATVAVLLAHDCLRHRAAASTTLYDGKLDALVHGTIELARFRLQGWQRVGARLGMALAYLGLFSLPITLVAAGASRPMRDHRAALLAYSLGALAGVAALAAGWSMPFGSNTLMDFGIGPRTIAGSAPGAPAWLIRLLTIVSCVGAAFLVRSIAALVVLAWRGNGLDDQRWKPIAAVLVAAGLFIPSVLADTEFFDRYLLASLPLLLVFAPDERSPPPAALTAVAAAIVAVFVVFSVAATHDYLAWHRARWAALAAIEAPGGITPADVQAGFEIDTFADPAAAALADHSCAPYVVSAAPLPRHVPILRVAVPAWLPGGVHEIDVLARPRDRPCARP